MNSELLNKIGIGEIDPAYFIIGLLVICLGLLIYIIATNKKIKTLNEKYKKFMSGKDGKTLENTIAKRFSQVDGSDTRKYGGSGLGLVISKQITELMNGTISVQSKEGIGSTFIAEIPVKIVKAAEAEVVEEVKKDDPALYSINNANGKNARILVAEDEPVNQQVIGKLLGMAGFSYDIAENGEKAVELYKEKEYDAALFDVQMPVMDGIAATQEIRKIESENKKDRLPIIAVTARAMFGDKERIMQNQLDDYIAKPYNLNTVVDTLNKYIDGDDDKDKKEADTDK